jgi:hypothetical protein
MAAESDWENLKIANAEAEKKYKGWNLKCRILLIVLFYVDIGLQITFQIAIKLNFNFIIGLELMRVCIWIWL